MVREKKFMKKTKYGMLLLSLVCIVMIPTLFIGEIITKSTYHSYEELVEFQDVIMSKKDLIDLGVHSVWINEEENSIVVEYSGENEKEIKKLIRTMNSKSIKVKLEVGPPWETL